MAAAVWMFVALILEVVLPLAAPISTHCERLGHPVAALAKLPETRPFPRPAGYLSLRPGLVKEAGSRTFAPAPRQAWSY